jgi:antitoxin VapB
MALQIANPVVVAKVERLAKATGLTKTALVERAVDRLASETLGAADPARSGARMAALLAQLDRIPDRPDAFDPLPWDSLGLPT